MSYTYLLESGEESLAGCYSDIQQFAQWRSSLIAGKSSCNDNGMDRLTAIGNGQDARVAATAFKMLSDGLM